MPSLDDILKDTMIFTAAGGQTGDPLAPEATVTTFEPHPTVSTDENVIQNNPVWTWEHEPDVPQTFNNIRSLVRGLGMNYAMPMPVCNTISLEEVSITTTDDVKRDLPLEESFVIRKHKLDSGHIPASSSGFWQLEAQVDQSLLIVYGYALKDGNVQPLTAADVQALGSDLMPAQTLQRSTFRVPGPSRDGASVHITLAPLRIILAWSLTCCKERPDFTPGAAIMGVNRIYPHAMVMASQPLKQVKALIVVQRPAKSPHAGVLPAEPGSNLTSGDEMLPDIRPGLWADTNNSPALIPLPMWDRIFDYYTVDPIGDGMTNTTWVFAADGAKNVQRTGTSLIQRLDPVTKQQYRARDFIKLPRQGDFDNLHLAPRMAAPSLLRIPNVGLDSIAMAPFCFHDCLHTHARWGAGYTDKPVKGFDNNFNPYSVAGAPLVPHNQEVRLNLIAPAGFGYEALAVVVGGKRLDAGRWTIFFHHGMAYANAIWDQSLFDTARSAVEFFAKDELKGPDGTRSTACFYWRLRFGGTATTALERDKILNLNGCRNL